MFRPTTRVLPLAFSDPVILNEAVRGGEVAPEGAGRDRRGHVLGRPGRLSVEWRPAIGGVACLLSDVKRAILQRLAAVTPSRNSLRDKSLRYSDEEDFSSDK